MSKLRRWGRRIVFLSIGTLFIELALRIVQIPAYMLPYPSRVGAELLRSSGDLIGHFTTTFSEALAGLLIGLVVSLLISIPASLHKNTRATISNTLVLIQSTPVVALGPILSAWMGPGLGAKAVLSSMVCLPAIAATLLGGLTSCPLDELQLYRSMGATESEILLLLRLPRAIPSLFSALIVGVPLAVLGALVGEFVGASRGLGFYIMTASYYLRTDQMFAAIIVAALGSIGFVELVKLARAKLSWERFAHEAP